jgi:hypothetical protein
VALLRHLCIFSATRERGSPGSVTVSEGREAHNSMAHVLPSVARGTSAGYAVRSWKPRPHRTSRAWRGGGAPKLRSVRSSVRLASTRCGGEAVEQPTTLQPEETESKHSLEGMHEMGLPVPIVRAHTRAPRRFLAAYASPVRPVSPCIWKC